MDAETVVAVCAVVIAVASLAVSFYEARAARQHNRHSVRPLLQLHRGRDPRGPREGSGSPTPVSARRSSSAQP